ncbi:BnaCnng20930D [Brassica napus]|uniref:BnaCnng20930D protein n=1 Tax=Brassica napus TaxID=3708 RepID=A0A078IQB6_BRANA|nr:BnaCnng20930D [Brassica napus]
MATSKISLSELKPGSCSRTVVLRFSVFGSYKCEERSNNDFKLLDSIFAI